MFTGIIEEIGTISHRNNSGNNYLWTIQTSIEFLKDVKIGDSISVAGICQTVTKLTSNSFSFFSGETTIKITTLRNYKIKDKINLEKALHLNDRLDGHFIYGHIESTAIVESIIKKPDLYFLTIKLPKQLKPYVINKGSIAIDGVSLTIAELNFPNMTIQIIPHTWNSTTFQFLKLKTLVNIETDILGKYVIQSLKKEQNTPLLERLKKNGFL